MLAKTAIETFVPAQAAFAGQPNTHDCTPPPPSGGSPGGPPDSGSGGDGNIVCVLVTVHNRPVLLCMPV